MFKCRTEIDKKIKTENHGSTLMSCTDKSIIFLQRLELARATGDLHSESCTLCHLGNCLRAKGNYEEAVEYYQMV